jgi:hypothetical protein
VSGPQLEGVLGAEGGPLGRRAGGELAGVGTPQPDGAGGDVTQVGVGAVLGGVAQLGGALANQGRALPGAVSGEPLGQPARPGLGSCRRGAAGDGDRRTSEQQGPGRRADADKALRDTRSRRDAVVDVQDRRLGMMAEGLPIVLVHAAKHLVATFGSTIAAQVKGVQPRSRECNEAHGVKRSQAADS